MVLKEKKKIKIIQEFKEFISRGNVVDMAVGIIIGNAFTAIVNSLVNDVIMPIIGLIIGGISFDDLKIVITPASEGVAESALYYGTFIQKVVDFLIIALVVFTMVKLMNTIHRRRKKEEKKEEAPKPAENIVLLTEIRDLLKAQSSMQPADGGRHAQDAKES